MTDEPMASLDLSQQHASRPQIRDHQPQRLAHTRSATSLTSPRSEPIVGAGPAARIGGSLFETAPHLVMPMQMPMQLTSAYAPAPLSYYPPSYMAMPGVGLSPASTLFSPHSPSPFAATAPPTPSLGSSAAAATLSTSASQIISSLAPMPAFMSLPSSLSYAAPSAPLTALSPSTQAQTSAASRAPVVVASGLPVAATSIAPTASLIQAIKQRTHDAIVDVLSEPDVLPEPLEPTPAATIASIITHTPRSLAPTGYVASTVQTTLVTWSSAPVVTSSIAAVSSTALSVTTSSVPSTAAQTQPKPSAVKVWKLCATF